MAVAQRSGRSYAYFFGDARRARAAELAATADRTNSLKAALLSFLPSRMSMARRVFPSRLELNSFWGSWREAPRKKVSFTTCLYDSPVQTPPSWDQTGVPIHFHSSWISGSASWMSWRTQASVSPLQSPSSWILFVIFFEAAAPFGARFAVMISPTRALISPTHD